jgi:uracil-DNA glycosylase
MQVVAPKIESSWKKLLNDEFQKPYFADLKQFLIKEKSQYRIFPPGEEIFSAFDLTPFEKVKVVILGQDPYHGVGQAHGLCFSVKAGTAFPPSLLNIYKEIEADLGIPRPNHGNLTAWAQQGVLLLNTVLTVRENTADSHKNKGWEKFTDSIIGLINENSNHIVFVLWGNNAKAKASLIDSSRHCILTAAHPSPLSATRGFFGCKHFSKINEYLTSKNISPINWQL